MGTLRKTKVNLRTVPSWLTIGTPSGTNDGESTVQVSAYTGREDRTATITAETSGGATDTATINQSGKPAHITIATKNYSVSAIGGSINITGTSNVASFTIYGTTRIPGASYKLLVNDVEDSSWNIITHPQINGDPGATSDFSFTLEVTYPPNYGASELQDIFSIETSERDVTSGNITVTQASGVKTYSEITIETFTYPTIAAKGGTVNPTLSYSQTWGWNGSTTGGGKITSGASISYDGDVVIEGTGAVTASSKGTVVSSETTIDTVTVNVSLNGKTKTASFVVKQAANAIISYGDVIISGGTVHDIPASGGSVSSASGISASQTITYTSEATRAGEVDITYSSAVSAPSLGTTVKSRTLIGQLVATANGENSENTTKEFDVYQAANEITYGNVSLPLTTPVSLQAQGQTYDLGAQVDAKFAQTLTFTSGASRNGEIVLEEYVVNTAKEGFSLNDSTGEVTVVQNPGTAARNGFVVSVTVTGEGNKSISTNVTFNQQGNESYITVIPDVLEFEATGGTKTITIESNDSWTIS